MSIQIFSGLPGSGKSSRLIELVNSAIAQNEAVLTFACGDSPYLANRGGMRDHQKLACRQPGLTCPLHHFVSTAEAAGILSGTRAGTLAAFEEAQYFDPEIAHAWKDAAERGVQILVSTPSNKQLELLKDYPYRKSNFAVKCQKCGRADASRFVVMPEDGSTKALCPSCYAEMREAARVELLDRLQKQPPHPGEKAIYQPVDELPECADWKVVRPDSKARVEVMKRIVEESGLTKQAGLQQPTYLDIGCNTGYFCHHMGRLGFYAEGVDVVAGDIAVAKLLDAFFRHDHNSYLVQNAYDYLEQTQDRLFDVTSAFAIFQWLMIQTTVERGLTCLEWFFAKTKRVCFLEMGYSAEPQYKERLKVHIDRDWVRRIMEEKGGFSEIHLFDAKEQGLMFGREVFVGIKAAGAASA